MAIDAWLKWSAARGTELAAANGKAPPPVEKPKSDEAPPPPPLVLVAFLFPAFAGFNFGYDIGSTGGAITQLKAVPDASALNDSALLTGLLTSGSLFGAVAGTLLSFAVASPLGRRRELILSAVLYICGTAICFMAPEGEQLLHAIFLGRGVYGLGIAFAMHAAPVYIAEVAPASVRGLLVALKEGFIVIGILAGFCASALVVSGGIDPALAWRLVWLPPGATGAIVMVGMCFMPSSPRWLVLRALTLPAAEKAAYLSRASTALARLRSSALCSIVCDHDAVDAEVRSIETMLSEETSGGAAAGSCAEVLSARRALIAGLGLVLLQQVTGQPSVLYYQEAIFRDAGFEDLAPYASVVVGGAKLIATMYTVTSVEHHGRRPLLFAGISMMLVALVALAFAFHERPQPQSPHDGLLSSSAASTMIVTALMVYVCGYQVGFGPIAWLMIAEVFPLKTRASALSIAVTVNFGFNLLATFSLPLVQDWFDSLEPGRGMAWLFMTYAAFCVASLVFVGACVPETKGKTLEQIEAELADHPQGGASRALPMARLHALRKTYGRAPLI